MQPGSNTLNGMLEFVHLILGMKQVIHGVENILRVDLGIQFKQESRFDLQ